MNLGKGTENGGSVSFPFFLPELVDYWECLLSLSLPQSKPLGGMGVRGEQWLASSLRDCVGGLGSGGEY